VPLIGSEVVSFDCVWPTGVRASGGRAAGGGRQGGGALSSEGGGLRPPRLAKIVDSAVMGVGELETSMAFGEEGLEDSINIVASHDSRRCECASVRVCECASVRVCECASVRVCECASVRVTTPAGAGVWVTNRGST
jgi:hypothetical protein